MLGRENRSSGSIPLSYAKLMRKVEPLTGVVDLGKCRGLIRIGGAKEASVDVQVTLEPFSSGEVLLSVEGVGSHSILREVCLTDCQSTSMRIDGSDWFDVYLVNVADSVSVFRTDVEGFLLGDSNGVVDSVVFQLFGWPCISGDRKKLRVDEEGAVKRVDEYVLIESDEWCVEIWNTEENCNVNRGLRKRLRLPSHVGVLRSEKGDGFRLSDANDFLFKFELFCSFVMGFRSGPEFLVGVDQSGGRKFELVGGKDRYCGFWNSQMSWVPDGQMGVLGEVFRGFCELLSDDEWLGAVKTVLNWRELAGCGKLGSSNLEIRLASAQVCLEKLAYRVLTSQEWKLGGPMGAKINKLLKKVGVDAESDSVVLELKRVCGVNSVGEFLVYCRNDQIHAEVRKIYSDEQVMLAWKVSMWCVDLVLLRLFRYQGCYASRLVSDLSEKTRGMPLLV